MGSTRPAYEGKHINKEKREEGRNQLPNINRTNPQNKTNSGKAGKKKTTRENVDNPKGSGERTSSGSIITVDRKAAAATFNVPSSASSMHHQYK